MSLSTDALLERMRLKAQLMKWRSLAIIMAAAFAFVLYGDGLDLLPGRSYIAKIEISGILQEDYERDRKIKDLADDGNAEAVIVYINTPGGTVVGGESIYKILKELQKSKPVVGVMGTLATSAGYMVALGTEEIFA